VADPKTTGTTSALDECNRQLGAKLVSRDQLIENLEAKTFYSAEGLSTGSDQPLDKAVIEDIFGQCPESP